MPLSHVFIGSMKHKGLEYQGLLFNSVIVRGKFLDVHIFWRSIMGQIELHNALTKELTHNFKEESFKFKKIVQRSQCVVWRLPYTMLGHG